MAMTERLTYGETEDRTLPAVGYGLYLLGMVNGLTILIGLILAYAKRSSAGERMRTHYTFLIRTFWIGIAWFVIGGLLILFGLPLTILLVGVPIVAVGWLICSAVGLWFIVRIILGVIYLARGEPYPRPYAWLV
jgi:uncharacterized membrane protein